METLKRNCNAISAKSATLAQRLLSYDKKTVELEKTRSGDFTFKYAGKYFHSRYDPWKEAEQQADEITSKKPDWVILFGLGCGYLLKALVMRKADKVIIYEPSMEILRGVLGQIDLSEALLCDDVVVCSEIDEVATAVWERAEGLDNLLGYQTTPYRQAFPEKLADYVNKINNTHIMNKVRIRTEIDSRFAWLDNYFSNVGFYAGYPSIDCLKDRFKGLPLIIAGAGPSLEKNGHLLKSLKGKAVIIAAVTAYKILLNYGVVPDFVIASEKVDLLEYFTGKEIDREPRLILGELSHPNMFKREARGKFVYFNAYLSLSARQAMLWGSHFLPSSGGSVTTAALDIGIFFGCEKIIMLGQDLCFSELKTHAGGGVYVKQNIVIDKENGEVSIVQHYDKFDESGKPFIHTQKRSFTLLWLKGLDGRPVPSKYDWVTFHRWFENYMQHLKKTGSPVKVINATEGGVYIEGMEHTTLVKAVEGIAEPVRPIDEIIEDASRHAPEKHPEAALESFLSMEENMKKIRKLARSIKKSAQDAARQFSRTGLALELKNKVNRIQMLEKSLFESAGKADFLWEALVEYTYDLKAYLRKEQDSDPEKQFKNDLDCMIAAYGAVEDACARLLPMIGKGIDGIKEFKSGRNKSIKRYGGYELASNT